MGNNSTKADSQPGPNANEKKETKDKFTDGSQSAKPLKVILVGPFDTGKSTIFKHVLQESNHPFADDEYNMAIYARLLRRNAVNVMAILCRELNSNPLQHLDEKSASNMEEILALENQDDPPLQIERAITELWDNLAIQEAYSRCDFGFYFQEEAKFYIESMERSSVPEFQPTFDDILRLRIRTTGIVERNVSFKNVDISLWDVGGSRGERKKMIYMFEGADVVVIVLAVNDFDRCMWEDGTTSRFEDSGMFCSEMLDSKWFKKAQIILVLNRIDLLQEKLKRVKVSSFYPEYQGPNEDAQEVAQFFAEIFTSSAKRRPDIIQTMSALYKSDIENLLDNVICVRNLKNR
jgi:GTPase SAR1 family protein